MATIQRFEQLAAWQNARNITLSVYRHSGRGSFFNDVGLRNQIRRASVSLMSNIAEGFDSRTNRQFVDFLGRAKASAGEVRSQLHLARDLGYINSSTCAGLQADVDLVGRQIRRLMQYLDGTRNQLPFR